MIHELQTCHNHARDPEENNIRTRYEITRWVPVGEVGSRFFFFGPAHSGKRPQPARCPRVEYVIILFPIFRIRWPFDGNVPVLRKRTIRPLFVPDGDTVSPPKLATDTPVLDVLQPVQIGLGPAFGVKVYRAVAHDLFGFFDLWVFEKPLLGEARFDGNVRAFGEADVIFVRFAFEE